jgi:RNA polymerase sigma factor (sigma-70 family)
MEQAMTEAVASGTAASLRRPARLLSDDRLMRLAADGDRQAFEAIYRRYHQEVYRYCLAILRSPEDATDALQSTMANALRSLPGEPRQIPLKPWLYRVAHNEAVTILRQRPPSIPLEDAPQPEGPSASQQAEMKSRLRELVADLGSLPERPRGALVMRELSGLSYSEIGSAFGTSSAAAKQTVYEARAALHEIAGGREMDCEVVRQALSADDGRVLRGRKLRAHLRHCADCRDFRMGIRQRRSDLAALAPPLPALAAAGLLKSLVGGKGGTVGTGVLGLLGGGGGTTLATSGTLKAGAALLATAAIGVGTADVAGVVDAPSVDLSGSTAKHSSSSGAVIRSDSRPGPVRAAVNDQIDSKSKGNHSNNSKPAAKSSQASVQLAPAGHGSLSQTKASSGTPAGPSSVGRGHRGFGHAKAQSHAPQLPPQAKSHPTPPAHPAPAAGTTKPKTGGAPPKAAEAATEAPPASSPSGPPPGKGKP